MIRGVWALVVMSVVAMLSASSDAVEPLSGPAQVGDALKANVQAAVDKDGVAVLAVSMPKAPCAPGDAIGLFRADDPRTLWEAAKPNPICFSWAGLLRERPDEGFIALPSALRLADVASKDAALWTVFPNVKESKPSEAELRAMIHLALAYGSTAVLIADDGGPKLSKIVEGVSQKVAPYGKTLAGLKHGGSDVRCKDARVMVIPRRSDQCSYVYAINLSAYEKATANVMLWDDVWDWTIARDLYRGKDLTVSPRDEEGYLSVTITLEPGEGCLIETDAHVGKKG